MSEYIVLNFEDKIDDTGKGAAHGTISGLRARYEVRKQPKGIKSVFLSSHSVTEYRCVEKGPPLKFTDDAERLTEIKGACSTAKKIYLVLHGDPRTTDCCYTNAVPSTAGVVRLASARELATFLAKVLVGRKDEYRLALVMCYGARCKNYLSANVNHQGMIPQSDLVTSFAYRLYHALVHTHAIKARLSAVTGKISHDSTTGGAMVEVEEMIDVHMELSDAFSAKRASMKEAVGEIKPVNEQDDTYKSKYDAWTTSDAGIASIKRVQAAQKARNEKIATLPTPKNAGTMHKYGKIAYQLKGGTLTIISKYGDSATSLKPGTVLYSGPLLTPG